MPRDPQTDYSYRTWSCREDWAKLRKKMEEDPGKEMNFFKFFLNFVGFGLKISRLENLGKRKALDVKLSESFIHLEKFPSEFDGFKILQISDPHFDAMKGLDQQIIKAVLRAGEVDICVLTGDYRLANEGPHDHLLDTLKKLTQTVKTRHGIWAILGNHDDHTMVESFEKLGIQWLLNEHLFVSRSGSMIQFTGLDDVNKFETDQASAALGSRLCEFAVALVHSPDYVDEAADAGYRAYLCGHTHGGQVCLPGGKPIVTHLNKGHDFAKGQWQCGDMQGITSNGAGVSGLPIRFFSKSEVNLITLKTMT